MLLIRIANTNRQKYLPFHARLHKNIDINLLLLETNSKSKITGPYCLTLFQTDPALQPKLNIVRIRTAKMAQSHRTLIFAAAFLLLALQTVEALHLFGGHRGVRYENDVAKAAEKKDAQVSESLNERICL